MKKLSILILFTICNMQMWAANFDGVHGIIERRVPWLKDEVVFEKVNSVGSDFFQLQWKDNKLLISATDANAAAMGLGWYLKYYCHRSMSHMGDNLSPVLPLPTVKGTVHIDANARYRYALNYCTYNYTMSFYTWQDWEHELDWMALSGINLLLVANGEEALWQKVLQRLHFSEKEISDFIPGPGYTAWWLMGNLEGWGGPMPQSQVDSRKQLQLKMLERMSTLGIEPILPGYYGVVPTSFKNKTHAHILPQGNWNGFARPDMLDPTDTAFDRVADIYYDELRKMYGNNIRFFSGDPFHEGGDRTGVDMSKAGAAIQKAMQRNFPNSIWALQGWQENPRKELLTEVNRKYVLVQELYGEITHNWEIRQAYEGTPFVWCIIDVFGERPDLYGRLQRYADEVYRANNSPYKNYMMGVGIMPEGLNNNPVAYDLVLELGWHHDHVNVAEWIKGYEEYRYGVKNENIAAAWKLFLNTIYSNHNGGSSGLVLSRRPSEKIGINAINHDYDTAMYARAVALFDKVAHALDNSAAYQTDKIDFVRQLNMNRLDAVWPSIQAAYNAKDTVTYNKCVRRFEQIVRNTDNLLNENTFWRLSAYEQQAIQAGNTPEEKKNNLVNLLMLNSYWGSYEKTENPLHDYAFKEWAGMLTTYYLQRWELFFDYQRKQMAGIDAEKPAYYMFEREWVEHMQNGMK